MGLESIGKHISEFRHLQKLRQEDLAEITGLSTNYIRKLQVQVGHLYGRT